MSEHELPAGDAGTVSELIPPQADAEAGTTRRARREARASQRRRRTWRRFAIAIAVALGIGIVVRLVVLEPYSVPTPSMSPTLKAGDDIMVNRLAYDFGSVTRGDIVVFSRPADLVGIDDPYLVKRVIGLPGETVSGLQGSVFIDGKRLAEPWLEKGVRTQPFPAVTVAKGDYFVMGDNRGNSTDSRTFGPIPGSSVVGQVVMRWWPPWRLAFF